MQYAMEIDGTQRYDCLRNSKAVRSLDDVHDWIIEEVIDTINKTFRNMEVRYNTKQIHAHCDYMSPDNSEHMYEDTHKN